MKSLVFVLLALLSWSALAEKYEVFSTTYGYGRPTVTMSWETNRPLGRAWLSVRVDTSDGDSDLGDNSYEQKIEGLRYDEASKRIVLDRDGKITECARFDNGSFFRTARWVSTNCRLSYKLMKRPFDDGFRINKYDVVVVYLTTQE